MNDNEKLSLAKALTANSRRMMELVEANNALVESLVRSLEQSQVVFPLDWKDAPHWAKYAAQDENGDWYWYEDKPYVSDSDEINFWNNVSGTEFREAVGEFSRNENWRDTLHQRQSTPEQRDVQWDLIPAGYNWIAKDAMIGWYAYRNKPDMHTRSWLASGGYVKIDSEKCNLPDVKWRESLMKRPDAVAETIADVQNVTNKPSWSDAPEWARWLAQDKNGWWHWYTHKPEAHHEQFTRPIDTDGTFTFVRAAQGDRNPSWRDTLEERPVKESEFSVNWSEIPDWANYVAQDRNGSVWAYELEPKKQHEWWYPDRTNDAKAMRVSSGRHNNNWHNTLTERPKQSVWDNAPEWAKWLAMDRNDKWYFYSDKPETAQRIWVHTEDAGIHERYVNCPLRAED